MSPAGTENLWARKAPIEEAGLARRNRWSALAWWSHESCSLPHPLSVCRCHSHTDLYRYTILKLASSSEHNLRPLASARICSARAARATTVLAIAGVHLPGWIHLQVRWTRPLWTTGAGDSRGSPPVKVLSLLQTSFANYLLFTCDKLSKRKYICAQIQI